ncbi:MAG: DUF1385 domain-containing protein [Thermodesulfobacteriota bacterium]|nr:DUF1385 domain-containing protein [Thermodesulfobacteriota bacterium]
MTRISVGGQAVIEGVMMRSPNALAIAVRKPTGEVVVKEDVWRSLSNRLKFLKWPLIRGSVVLIETLINGLQALSFSASQAMEEEKSGGKEEGKLSSLALSLVMAAAFGIGILFFVVLPHYLTGFLGDLFGQNLGVESFSFHLIDGLIKIIFFVGYIYLISFMPDIRRIFQYHGAEHKCIYAYEAGEELNVSNVRKYSTLHPRCGTAFLLIVFIISIVLFSLIFPFLPKFPTLSKGLSNLIYIGIKLPLILPIAGLAYEVIKLSGKKPDHPLLKIIIAPGLWLQRMTTRPPTDDQIEIALRALKGALNLESGQKAVL